jgi:serine/threonine-protein kinase RsbW
MTDSITVSGAAQAPSLPAPGAAGRGPRRDAWWLVTVDGERLRRARLRAGLSQQRLADAAGVSLTTVLKLESKSRARCRFTTMEQVAAGLGAHPQAITAQPDDGRHWPESRATASGGQASSARAAARQAATAEWQCSRVFPGSADQVAQARAFLRQVLVGCPMTDDIVLICSELAANAARHSASAKPGGKFTVRAEIRGGDYAWVEVEDQGGRWHAGEKTDEGRRGLAVVDELAAYWDIRGDDTGRVVCARLDWPPGDTA